MYQLWVLGFDFALGMLETRASDRQMYVSGRGGNPKSPLGRTMYIFDNGLGTHRKFLLEFLFDLI